MKVIRHVVLAGLLATLGAGSLKAQDNILKATNMFSIGAGYPNMPTYMFKIMQNGEPGYVYNLYPAAHIKYERGLSNKLTFGVGLSGAYSGMRYTYARTEPLAADQTQQVYYTERVKGFDIMLNLRLNYYWFNNNRFLMYSGIGAGYHYNGLKYTTNDISTKTVPGKSLKEFEDMLPVGYEVTIFGLKYLLNDGIGLYGEVGYGQTLVNMGVFFKWDYDDRW